MTNGAAFTALQVANLHRVSRSTVYRRIKSGQYTAIKRDGRWEITLPMPADPSEGAFAAKHGVAATDGIPNSELSLVARGRLALRGF